MYGAAMSQQPPEGFVRARRRGTVTALVVVVLLALPTTAMATVGDPPTTSPASARIVLNGLAAVVGPMQDSTLPTSEQPARLPSSLSARVVIENRTDEENRLFVRTLAQMEILYLGLTVFIFIDAQYTSGAG